MRPPSHLDHDSVFSIDPRPQAFVAILGTMKLLKETAPLRGQDQQLLAMRIIGIEKLSPEELHGELSRGGRLVFYEYCISLVIVSVRSPSEVYFLRADEQGWLPRLSYSLLSLLLGWWGIPWGPIYTPLTLWTNLRGGRDVTAELRERLPASMVSDRW